MAKILNTAFVNSSARKCICDSRSSPSRDESRSSTSELFNPECPFCTVDEAYEAWLCHINRGHCANNQVLTINIKPGCYLLEKFSYSNVNFVNCCPVAGSQVLLVIDSRVCPNNATSFTNVTFVNVDLVRIFPTDVVPPPINVSTVNFTGTSRVLVTTQDIPGCPCVKSEKKGGSGHHKCDRCEKKHDHKCDDGGCRFRDSHWDGQTARDPPPQPQRNVSWARSVSGYSDTSLSWEFDPRTGDRDCNRPDPAIAPGQTISSLPSGSYYPYFVATPNSRNTFPLPEIANATTPFGLAAVAPGSALSLPLVFIINNGGNITIIIPQQGTPEALHPVLAVVLNHGGSVRFIETWTAFQATTIPRINLLSVPRASIVESDNTNITVENCLFEVGFSTMNTNLFGSSLLAGSSTPFYLFKLITASRSSEDPSDREREERERRNRQLALSRLITIIDSQILLVTGVPSLAFDPIAFSSVYLTNTTYYTAPDLVTNGIRLYGIYDSRNIVGPLFALQDGGSPTWNGATIMLPVRISENYRHRPFDGTVFDVHPHEDGYEGRSPLGEAAPTPALTGRGHHKRQDKRLITIVLPSGRLSHGRQLIYIRTDHYECTEVIIRPEDFRDWEECRSEGGLRLQPRESLTLHNINGEYFITARHRSRIGSYDTSDRHSGTRMVAPSSPLGRASESDEESQQVSSKQSASQHISSRQSVSPQMSRVETKEVKGKDKHLYQVRLTKDH